MVAIGADPFILTPSFPERRIYMDLEEERVLTINNQYAGNSVGLKKMSLRLAISKANKEDWLSEHMFVMGAKPEGKNRTTYFTGAFPSACGKTSTAMIPGQSIIGDDIAYIRAAEDGKAYAVNVEQGIFGIIQDVNPTDDALIYKAITTPRELIFSNVLIKEGKPFYSEEKKDRKFSIRFIPIGIAISLLIAFGFNPAFDHSIMVLFCSSVAPFHLFSSKRIIY